MRVTKPAKVLAGAGLLLASVVAISSHRMAPSLRKSGATMMRRRHAVAGMLCSYGLMGGSSPSMRVASSAASRAAQPLSLGGPPLPSVRLGHSYGNAGAPIVIDVYLDFTCPFSKKLFTTLHQSVMPMMEKKYPGVVLFREFNQVQPWHPASTLTHEAALAAEKLGGTKKYEEYAAKLYENQMSLMDDVLYDKSRQQVYEQLSDLGQEVGLDKSEMLKLLTLTGLDKPYEEREEHNAGNQMTALLKLYIKQSRKSGVHVSPTVFVNGLEDGAVSSGWTAEQWMQHFQPMLQAAEFATA